MKFNLLGQFELTIDGENSTPSAPKVRQVLALMTLRANQVVGLDAIIEELWEADPPRSAVTTAQTYVYQLRKTLSRLRPNKGADDVLFTRFPGYMLRADEDHIDARVFSGLLDRGRSLLAGGHVKEASRMLAEATGMWRGPVLANVVCGPLLRSYAANLEEQRTTALELRVAADMRLGRHRELIAELKSLIVSHPLNEWFHGQLIIALSKAGRRGEALHAYRDMRMILKSELGLDPSAELQGVHQMVLTLDRRPSRELSLELR
ncbi:transcriptional regulator [Spongiactinospora rosea]|uniref:Transcriptional regulator n=1 Tax=Spongiactinospora rosea TaxID=2248750 RepID=A0A366M2Q9_9ACTN|nr:AfsR/SARP family transcriptional regulator [Spongiactinospora rosea]RBQ20083.1 transcriptional regulator [Spongiactinospora rosea]